MLNNGFSIQDVLGQDILKNGMSEEQIGYFFSACVGVAAERINENTFAYSRVHADKESSKKMNRQLKDMENVLAVSLINKD